MKAPLVKRQRLPTKLFRRWLEYVQKPPDSPQIPPEMLLDSEPDHPATAGGGLPLTAGRRKMLQWFARRRCVNRYAFEFVAGNDARAFFGALSRVAAAAKISGRSSSPTRNRPVPAQRQSWRYFPLNALRCGHTSACLRSHCICLCVQRHLPSNIFPCLRHRALICCFVCFNMVCTSSRIRMYSLIALSWSVGTYTGLYVPCLSHPPASVLLLHALMA